MFFYEALLISIGMASTMFICGDIIPVDCDVFYCVDEVVFVALYMWGVVSVLSILKCLCTRRENT